MPDVSLLTLSRNLAHFERMADALGPDPAGLVTERILVNNGNRPDLTAAGLKRGWMVVEPGYNTSFSAGNNLAAQVAGAPALLLLNDDLRPAPGFLLEMAGRETDADVLGCMLLHSDGTVNHAGTGFKFGPQAGLITDHIGRHAHPLALTPGDVAVQAVTFAAVLIQRKLWDELDGLDERYFYGWEDTDFCMRAQRAGAVIRCRRSAVAMHDECGTRPRGALSDQTNAQVFAQTWLDGMPEMLKGYAKRLAPEQVEGI